MTLIGLAALLLAAGTATAENPREQGVSWLLDGLEATRSSCPEKIDYAGYTQGAICAEVEAETKQFRKRLRNAIHRGSDEPSVLLEERKSKDGTLYGARVIVKGQLADLYFESGSGAITVVSPLSCLTTAKGGVPLLASLRPELDNPPIADHRVPAVFPAQARLQRTPGAVVMDGTIDEKGQVTDTCVLFVSPAGVGFEEAGLSALRQWTFQPATLDGKPEPVAWRTVMTFEITSPWMD